MSGNAAVMLKKIVRRFQFSEVVRARKWAEQHSQGSIGRYCELLSKELWRESTKVSQEIEHDALVILSGIKHDLGGGSGYPLLYFLVRHHKPAIVVETGVAAGWSSKTILRGIAKNKFGKLFSSDFPYFRLKNPEQYIGLLARDEGTDNWQLFSKGDENNLPIILERLNGQKIDLFHYDSDKSKAGRSYALKLVQNHISDQGVFIMDDIQDDLVFQRYVVSHGMTFHVFGFMGKYIGYIPQFGQQLRLSKCRTQ